MSNIKNNDLFTRLETVSDEINYYKDQFKGKTVLCNCNDLYESGFFKQFVLRFNYLGLKRLIVTSYSKNGEAYKGIINEVDDVMTDPKVVFEKKANKLEKLNGDGDFRTDECKKLLDRANIVVTNPPVGLFKEYIKLLTDKKKDFLILGNINAVMYDEMFPLLKENKVWLGHNSGVMSFIVPEDQVSKKTEQRNGANGQKWQIVNGVCWYTNLDHKKHHEEYPFEAYYTSKNCKKYDNYNAIDVNRITCVPDNYAGEIGVPISFMTKYNPEQFEIVGNSKNLAGAIVLPNGNVKMKTSGFYIDGKRVTDRIVIKNKNPLKY